MPQNPTRQVHALLGAVELEDSLTIRDHTCLTSKILHLVMYGLLFELSSSITYSLRFLSFGVSNISIPCREENTQPRYS